MAKYKEFCPVCGMVNFDDKPRCFRCGQSLERTSKTPASRPAPAPGDPGKKRPR